MTERELMLTGIGGQGVQLAAQVLARAAVLEDRQVMLFGVYSGMMRGGNSDSTVVFADGPLLAPPLISRTWSAIVMHHKYWEPMRSRLRPDAVVLVNTPVFEAAIDRDHHRVFDVPATERAGEMGAPLTASMIMTGAYLAITGVVGLDQALEAMRRSLPPYRQQHVAANEAALRAGHALADAAGWLDAAPAWTTTTTATTTAAATAS
jgi:Pyruvate/2-oxoacid:ferredoxin oxidoreductase gamma subunit